MPHGHTDKEAAIQRRTDRDSLELVRFDGVRIDGGRRLGEQHAVQRRAVAIRITPDIHPERRPRHGAGFSRLGRSAERDKHLMHGHRASIRDILQPTQLTYDGEADSQFRAAVVPRP